MILNLHDIKPYLGNQFPFIGFTYTREKLLSIEAEGMLTITVLFPLL